MAPRMEENVRAESTSGAQPQHTRERLANDSVSNVLPSTNKPISSTTAAAIRTPSPSTNGSSLDRLKQEKLKGISSNSMDEVMPKKKVKRKPEMDLEETHFRPEKPPQQQGDDRYKSLKQAVSLPPKPNLPSTATNFEQSS
ncbi:hypothetical protein CCACVL1_30487 [Corchorus capsularis]|uniref:Uncharacterized protein n=1 Tax=Corchorus capsularis TaxID=210143 RepID=A0A1R3FXA1_COCAP|nr:hypothetical protein CCACVL1_30487 [Corchorus capsularis]